MGLACFEPESERLASEEKESVCLEAEGQRSKYGLLVGPVGDDADLNAPYLPIALDG